ncbi:hypothetical protein Tco_0604508 [Tanacetum coccineum]
MHFYSSQPAWELEGSNGSKMAGKRRSFVQDDLGYGGLMHRIRQKADPCSQGSSLSKHKSEFEARSRGRTAMYRMARSPYYRGPSTLRKKVC